MRIERSLLKAIRETRVRVCKADHTCTGHSAVAAQVKREFGEIGDRKQWRRIDEGQHPTADYAP
jgi:hypothetical protein